MKKQYTILLSFALITSCIFAQVDEPIITKMRVNFEEGYSPDAKIMWDVYIEEEIDHYEVFLAGVEIPDYEGSYEYGYVMFNSIFGTPDLTIDEYHNVGIVAIDINGIASDTANAIFYFAETAYARPNGSDFQIENLEDGEAFFSWNEPPFGGGENQPYVTGYSVYLNGIWHANTTEFEYTFTDLSFDENYVAGIVSHYSDGYNDSTFYPNYTKKEFYSNTLSAPVNMFIDESNAKLTFNKPNCEGEVIGGTFIGYPATSNCFTTSFGDGINYINTSWHWWIWWHNDFENDEEGVGFTWPGTDLSFNYANAEVKNIKEISEAECYEYSEYLYVHDAETNDGIGTFVSHYNMDNGYYGIIRVDDFYDFSWDNDPDGIGKIDFTWWFQTNGSDDFSSAYNYYPKWYNIYLDEEFVDSIIPGFEEQFDIEYEYQFENLTYGQTYMVGVEAIYYVGKSTMRYLPFLYQPTGMDDNFTNGSPTLSIHPNPISSHATISYSITETGPVTIEIYNTMGEKIKTLVDRELATGEYKINWSRHKETGNPVANGIYFCTLKTANKTIANKMIVH